VPTAIPNCPDEEKARSQLVSSRFAVVQAAAETSVQVAPPSVVLKIW
jgi:hypothetical protein